MNVIEIVLSIILTVISVVFLTLLVLNVAAECKNPTPLMRNSAPKFYEVDNVVIHHFSD